VSVDPLNEQYPELSAYQYASNRPITMIDLDGAEAFPNPFDQVIQGAIGMLDYGIQSVRSWFTTDKKQTKKTKEDTEIFSWKRTMEDIQEKMRENMDKTENTYKIKDPTFKEFYPTLLAHEGGYVNHPNDPGGHTNKGITMRTFKTYAEDLLGIKPTLENLKNLTDIQAGAIYEKGYWDTSKAGDISDKQIAWLYVDTFINGGGLDVLKSTIEGYGETYSNSNLSKSIKSLNKIIEKQGGENVFNAFKENRVARYEKLIEDDSKFEVFRTGWMNRVNSFTYQKNN
jgi:lysozyme family protein